MQVLPITYTISGGLDSENEEGLVSSIMTNYVDNRRYVLGKYSYSDSCIVLCDLINILIVLFVLITAFPGPHLTSPIMLYGPNLAGINLGEEDL